MTPRVRNGAGPYFLEVMTYRWREHVGPNHDYHLGYRTEEESKPWIESDQVPRLAGMIEPRRLTQIQMEVESEVATAFAFAEQSPEPALAELYTDVFKEN
jgi:TPP-dependent pyruvate/acetoin dehydrogenase alpha subunit